MNHIEQYEANQATFDFWIQESNNGQTPRLEISNDIFQPLIKPFTDANPGVNLNTCKDCILDMLRWVKTEWKNTLPEITAIVGSRFKTDKDEKKK